MVWGIVELMEAQTALSLLGPYVKVLEQQNDGKDARIAELESRIAELENQKTPSQPAQQ